MNRQVFFLTLLLTGSVLCPPRRAAAQRGEALADMADDRRPPVATVGIEYNQRLKWTVFGQVLALDGKPISGAKVLVDVGGGGQGRRTLETNLQGEFRTEYVLDIKLYKTLRVEAMASKAGYRKARETEQFSVDEGTRGIFLVLREETNDPDVLPLATLLASLAPRMREAESQGGVPPSVRKEYMRGTEQFLDKHDPVKAVPALTKAVEREPDCVECRTLLSLAQLEAGSWAGADSPAGVGRGGEVLGGGSQAAGLAGGALATRPGLAGVRRTRGSGRGAECLPGRPKTQGPAGTQPAGLHATARAPSVDVLR